MEIDKIVLRENYSFLHIIGHNVRHRVVGGRFYRLIKSIHRYFRVVLKGVLTLYKHLLDNLTTLRYWK